ncbi:MAG: Smr/MutS family protein [Muribaculaceae bacterium]|nr:Smr/MutS family protein [Muribaculaceae bacterium]
MIYPDTFEQKVGFASVRHELYGRCLTPGAREYVDSMQFRTDFDEVSFMLRSTAEMLGIIRGDEPIPLSDTGDLRDLIRALKVPGSFLPAAELLTLRRGLALMTELCRYFERRRPGADASVPSTPCLAGVASGLFTFNECMAAIDRILDRFGNVKYNASAELADIRKRLTSMSGAAGTALRRVMARAVQEGMLDADATPAMRDGRMVLPVAPMYKRRINGIVHDESASGKTVFIEPAEVVEINNRIRETQMEERREITRILTVVASELRPYADDMMASGSVLSELDFIHAKALYADTYGGTLPALSASAELEWYHACHPGLLASLRRQGKEVVPLDITLTPKERLLIISGPNAGGKSVCLKTVGIVQYMTQCGMLPPVYENSHFGIFDDIFVDIGDDQSLEDDLSTYSSHLRNMKLLLQRWHATSLVLIDEFGSGTEPQIGGALAQAILKQINMKGMWGVITTHYQNLKHFAEDTDGLVNGSMLYDRHLMQPLFRLSIGNPGSSFAIEIARKTGLSPEILADAEAIVGSDYVNMDKYLLDIARDRKYWENKRADIRKKEKSMEARLAQYENDAEMLRAKRREIIEEAKAEARKILEGSNAAIERTIRDIRNAQADKEQTAMARQRLKEERQNLEKSAALSNSLLDKAPRRKKKRKEEPISGLKPIAVGDIVKLDGEGTPGRVEEINGTKATVVFGMIKTTVRIDRLRHTSATIPSAASKGVLSVSSSSSDASRKRQLEFNREIDVRGMRVDEAVQAVTYFIDDAIQFNAGRVRILHGTGTGALRQYIRNYLDTVPGVRSYRDEHVQFGGAGITVVEFD